MEESTDGGSKVQNITIAISSSIEHIFKLRCKQESWATYRKDDSAMHLLWVP